jgi:hypothetical protein
MAGHKIHGWTLGSFQGGQPTQAFQGPATHAISNEKNNLGHQIIL